MMMRWVDRLCIIGGAKQMHCGFSGVGDGVARTRPTVTLLDGIWLNLPSDLAAAAGWHDYLKQNTTSFTRHSHLGKQY
jgi:hypothetical protein